jgi:hypothetical protein
VKNCITKCTECDRYFILTDSHLLGEVRNPDSNPISEFSENIIINKCDYCVTKDSGDLTEAIRVGLRQRTCPECRTECLSNYDK